MIKGLVKSDLYFLKNFAVYYIIFLGVFGLIGVVGENIFFSVFFLLYCGMLMFSIIDNDERTGFNKYLISNCTTKKRYVFGKYVTNMFMVFAAIFYYVFIFLINGIVKNNFTEKLPLLFFFLAIMFLFEISLVSIEIPVTLKYGSSKSRIILVVLYALIGAVGGGTLAGGKIMESNFITNISNVNTVLVFLICILISLVLQFVSMKISQRIVIKKDY